MTEMTPRLCTQCQQPVQSTDQFCGSCGTPLPHGPAPTKPVWKRWHKVVLGTLGGISLLILALVVMATLTTPPENPSTPHTSTQATASSTSASTASAHQGTVTLNAKTGKVTPSARTVPPPHRPLASPTPRTNPKDGARMLWIPAGSFRRGSTPSEISTLCQAIPREESRFHRDEQPQSAVVLDGYWIYQYEVTVAQYRTFCHATGHMMPPAPKWGWQERDPIVNITWQDASAYARWASVRLPTEAEWEKAARGTDAREYPWGAPWDTTRSPQEMLHPHPVGKYPKNASPYGVHDMAGNVREWCQDWYAADYYADSPNTNPTGPVTGTTRVIRGGSWMDASISDQVVDRCANRDNLPPAEQCNFVGFRCAASP